MKAGLSSGLFAISILKYLGFAPDGVLFSISSW